MKGKNLLILLAAVAVLIGAWLLLSRSTRASWTSSGTGGGKVVEFPLNDVARINIKSATSELNLVKKNDVWTVQERADYPASFEQVSGLLRKLWELKTVQEVKVGPSQFARLELVEPGKGDSAGTLVQMYGADGKPLQSLLLGKKQMRKGEGGDDQFGGMSAGFATGRYVKPAGGAKVSLVSDPLDDADPKAERWLNKDFIKVEAPRSVAVSGAAAADQKTPAVPAQPWTVARENATGEWKLADAKPEEKVDSSKVSGLGSVFSSASFTDVQAPGTKLEEPVTTAVIETFDGFKYELKIGKAKDDNQPVQVAVTGDFPKERKPAADEKTEDKKRLDDDFAAKLKQNEEKLAKEKKFEGRPYLVSKFAVEALLKERSALLAEKPAEPVKPADANAPAVPGIPGELPKPATPPVPVPVPPKPAKPVTPVKPATPVPGKPAATPASAVSAPVKPPEPPALSEVPKPAEPAKPIDSATPPAPAKPAEAPKTELPKPAEPAAPAEPAKPAESAKPADPAAPPAKP